MPEFVLRRFFTEAGYGCLIGMATLVPGISGGTVAYLLGIYTRLIAVLAALNADWWVALARLDTKRLAFPDWPLLPALMTGTLIVTALLIWGIGLHEWIAAWPRPFHGLFCGLIMATIWLFLFDTRFCPYRATVWFCGGATTGVLLLSGLSTQLPLHPLILFVAGAISLASMLLPGVSGAYLLLLLGLYTPMLDALATFDFAILMPFAVGGVSGLLLCARLLDYLLRYHRKPLLFFVNGLLLVSLWQIWPFSNLLSDATIHPVDSPWVVGIAFLIGLALTLLLHAARQRATKASLSHD